MHMIVFFYFDFVEKIIPPSLSVWMCNRKKEETYCIKKLKKLTIRLRLCERA